MAKALTVRAIETARPGAARREVPDGLLRGLYLIVQPSGAKSWAVRYRLGTVPRKFTLGPWPAVTLDKARDLGRDAIIAAKRGEDPMQDRRAAEAVNSSTLRGIAEIYLAREAKAGRLRTIEQRRDAFERLIYPVLGNKPIGEIKRSDIVRLLDKVEDANGPRMADICLATVGKLMNWHATRDDDFKSPIVKGMGRALPAAERARDRILSDDELRRVWRAAEATPGPFGALVKFLLLTAARRNEAARMTWSELTGLDWTLPEARNKVKEDLVRPLSAAALAVLTGVPRIDGSEFVFTGGRQPFHDFSRAKRALDAKSGVTSWCLHDLRRTARSLMSRAGVNSDHAERCLGHVIGGVRGVYDKHKYRDEMLRAYELLAAQVARILDPQDNVVPLTRPA
jgi:integrase